MGGGSYVFIESGSHTNAQLTARSNVGAGQDHYKLN